MFEFNNAFLKEIAYHTYSMRFGTFLYNSDSERMHQKVRHNTVSLWTYINTNIEKYKNPFYVPNDPAISNDKFYPDPLLINLRVWEDIHLEWGKLIDTTINPR